MLRRERFVRQSDALAGQRRERRRVDVERAARLARTGSPPGAPYRKRAVTGSGSGLCRECRTAGAGPRSTAMRSGTNASTRNSAVPIGGALGIGAHLDRPGPGRRATRQRDRHIDRVIGRRAGVACREHLPVRPLDGHARRKVGRQAGVVAQQRHHLHRLARPVDAAIEPDERIERPGMRPRPATPRSDRSNAAAFRSSAAKSPSAPNACSTAGASGPSPCSSGGGEARRRRPRPWSPRRGCRCCARASAAARRRAACASA